MKRIKPQHFLILLLVAAIAAAPFLIRGLIDRSSVGKQPAAAVTAAIMTMSALQPEQPKRVSFHANRPFAYIITDRADGAILFMGQFTGE